MRLIISNLAEIEDASPSSKARLARFRTTVAVSGGVRVSAKLKEEALTDLLVCML